MNKNESTEVAQCWYQLDSKGIHPLFTCAKKGQFFQTGAKRFALDKGVVEDTETKPKCLKSPVMRIAGALCNSRCMDHEVWSHREEWPGHILISEESPNVYL